MMSQRFYCLLSRQLPFLIVFFAAIDIKAQEVYTVNPFVQPNDTTLNWRSSGDSDGNDTLTWNDAVVLRDYLEGNFSPDPGDKRFGKRADINRNGILDYGDLSMLEDHITNNKFFMPGWYWNKLKTPEARDQYLAQAAGFDVTNEIPPTPYGQIPTRDCRFYSNQTMINFNGFSDPTDTSNLNMVYPYDWENNGLENIPLLDVKVNFFGDSADTDWLGGHEMNGIIVENDALAWEGYNFFEPQFDQRNVQIGEAYMDGDNTRVTIGVPPVWEYWGFPDRGKYEIIMSPYVSIAIDNQVISQIISLEDHSYYFIEHPEYLPIYERDTIYPAVSVSLENNFSYEPGEDVHINITDEYFKSAWYSLDRGYTKMNLQTGQTNFNLPVQEGECPVYIYASDQFYNEVLDSLAITVYDSESPTITISSPVIASTYGASPEITISIEDFSFEMAQYSVDQSSWVLISQDTTFTTNLGFGKHTLYVEAEDTNGNTSMDSVSFTIADLDPPTTPVGLVASEMTETTAHLEWNASTDNVGVARYAIFLDDQQMATSVSNSYTVYNLQSNTTYQISVSANDEAGNESAKCVAIEVTTLDPTVGIVENVSNSNVRIYPNPVGNLLNIEKGDIGSCNIKISSLNGKIIYEQEIMDQMHQIDLSSFQKGIYFITIRSEDFVTTRKIIKL